MSRIWVMDQEAWQFTFIFMGAAVLILIIICYDVFSLGKFWARRTRRQNPPPSRELYKAHTRHQRFFHQTGRRLISTTYVSFYLFVLSVLGLLVINGIIILQGFLDEGRDSASELSLRLFFITFFFLISRWYYRQESHHLTAQKVIVILLGVILIDLVHLLTHKPYGEVVPSLLIIWIWTGGILQAILGYEVNYSRDIAYSLGAPWAILSVLFLSTSSGVFLILLPPLVLVMGEWIQGTEFRFERMKRFIPNQFPFHPRQPATFLGDISQVMNVRETFRKVSPWEVLYWALLTPVVLIPVTVYLQARENRLMYYQDSITDWAQKEWLIDPETAADRLGLILEDTYPLLNELVEEEKLQIYETPQGLRYGLPSTGELESFIERFNLHKIDLIQKDRDFLDYLWGKQRKKPPTATLISALDRSPLIEISIESVGGSVSSLKPVITLPMEGVQACAQELFKGLGELLGTLGYLRKYTLSSNSYLKKIIPHGKNLLTEVLPSAFQQELRMHHLIIETDLHHIPFELMCSDVIFSLYYAMGRRLRVGEEEGFGVFSGEEDVETSRVLLICDPEDSLPSALEECEYVYHELESLLPVCYLKKDMATRDTVMSCFQEGYSIIHYAGHVSPRGIPLADGELTLSDIRASLKGHPLVFINGCNSAGANASTAEHFLRAGAMGYIGSIWEIHDVSAARLAVDFYFYTAGHTIGEALRLAKEKAFQERNIAWTCFILFGDPTVSLI